jgi:hypothetical protein
MLRRRTGSVSLLDETHSDDDELDNGNGDDSDE